MFAILERQAGLRTHERMLHAGESPSHVGRSGFQIRRYSFTVAGAVPGSHRLPVSLGANIDRYRDSGQAPDNFAEDPNCRKSAWQGANASRSDRASDKLDRDDVNGAISDLMKALSILGSGSGAGKSWITTALGAWLHGQGIRVAPFKAQNMANNAWVTLDGGEIGRAQAVQAEACGLTPTVEMNPILLKPSGTLGSQLIVLGQAEGHCAAAEYYRRFDRLWRIVMEVLDGWHTRCDVLLMEGAGSPVELNLSHRDLVNLRPCHYVDGRWIFVGDIDRGGIFAQLAGAWTLLSSADRARSLGHIVNRFRGDLALFSNPQQWLEPYAPGFATLGTLPLRADLQPEEEDGLAIDDKVRGTGDVMAWVRFPHLSNLTDCQPWWTDTGVQVRWVTTPRELEDARVIVLPGTKNTLADLRWLRACGLADAIVAASHRGALIIGVCGGFQMLGESLRDVGGDAGDAGAERGLGLLPADTSFGASKILRQVTANCAGREWQAYEIHMGSTLAHGSVEPLQTVRDAAGTRPEGMRLGAVWGTYLHGWFESPQLRAQVAAAAGMHEHRPHPVPWAEQRAATYRAMAEHLAAHVNLDPIRRYLCI
jgi:adenosylcobyric acid synthase